MKGILKTTEDILCKKVAKVHVLPERLTFASLVRRGEKRQKNNFKYYTYDED